MELPMFRLPGLVFVAGAIFGSALVSVLYWMRAHIASVAKRMRRPLKRCVVAALGAVAWMVGVAAVAVFYPPVALAKAIGVAETKEDVNKWTFRIFFGGGVVLAILGAIVTIIIVRSR